MAAKCEEQVPWFDAVEDQSHISFARNLDEMPARAALQMGGAAFNDAGVRVKRDDVIAFLVQTSQQIAIGLICRLLGSNAATGRRIVEAETCHDVIFNKV